MAESCIQNEGKIVLFPIVGCYISEDDSHDKMYGLWEKSNGKKEMVCWKYDNVILVYTLDNKVLSFLPTEQKIDCPDARAATPSIKPETTPNLEPTDESIEHKG